ncbi:MAG: hypothetical protein Q8Q48_04340 [Candidatus Staskawiczbacteria bacterium]|nr:hypothetical protein [Candidatus Staskawiczbacteria bacterium]
MNKTNFYRIGILAVFCVALLSVGNGIFAQQAPIANAGPDIYLVSGQTTMLQGSVVNTDGYNLFYSWNCTGGTLSSSNVVQPVYTAPYIYQFNNQTSYVCTLTATNNYGQSNSDSVTIFINSNNNVGGLNVQTNSATSVYNNQATLNGYVSNPVYGTTTYTWFQWGTTTGYGYESTHQTLGSAGSFTQNIANLSQNTTYHFRAVAQTNYGNVVYGQDMTFYTSGSGNYYPGTGNLVVTKKVINLTSGNLNWQASVNANPNDVLSFVIILQSFGQDLHNVFVRDFLPVNLLYADNLTVNSDLYYSGNPQSGISIGTLPAGQIYVIAYQARVAPAASIAYGTSILSNEATVTSSESGTKTTSASVIINNSIVQGAVIIPTGTTNNPVTDSFLLPIALIILGSWFYFSGNIYRFSDWLDQRI